MLYVKVKTKTENGFSNRVIKYEDLPDLIKEIQAALETYKIDQVWFIGFVNLEPEDFEKRNKDA